MLNNFQDIQTLLAGPKFPNREFIRSGATFGEVYAMATGFRAAFSGPACEGAAVCLAVDNRAVMAAVLLAALAGGPTLLLPYAFSAQALARMQQLTGFTTAIADGDRALPPGVTIIRPPARVNGDGVRFSGKRLMKEIKISGSVPILRTQKPACRAPYPFQLGWLKHYRPYRDVSMVECGH